MSIDLSALKARLAKASVTKGRSDSLLTITDNLPVTFHVLLGDWSEKCGWLLPCGVHFVDGKQIVCREIAEAGTCSVCERIRRMEREGVPESQIFPIRGPKKYAMNVLVKGEQSPRVYLAVASVGEEIARIWEAALDESNVNIFDPMASFPWTVLRSKRDGRANYQVSIAQTSEPIVTGDKAEERIERILKSAANLDERFKLPVG
jgi:hypothetical protein